MIVFFSGAKLCAHDCAFVLVLQFVLRILHFLVLWFCPHDCAFSGATFGAYDCVFSGAKFCAHDCAFSGAKCCSPDCVFSGSKFCAHDCPFSVLIEGAIALIHWAFKSWCSFLPV